MRLLPYRTFTADSNERPDALLARLSENVDRPILPFLSKKPLIGRVGSDGFVVSRRVGYRNSFNPRFRGRVEPRSLGARAQVTMTLHPFVLSYVLVWVGIPTVVAVGGVAGVLFGFRGFPPLQLAIIILGLVPVGIGVALGRFWYAVADAKEALRQALDVRSLDEV